MEPTNGAPKITAQDILDCIKENRHIIEVAITISEKMILATLDTLIARVATLESMSTQIAGMRTAPTVRTGTDREEALFGEPEDHMSAGERAQWEHAGETCPKCGSDIWINPPGTKSQTTGKPLPLKKCKSSDCDYREWAQRKRSSGDDARKHYQQATGQRNW